MSDSQHHDMLDLAEQLEATAVAILIEVKGMGDPPLVDLVRAMRDVARAVAQVLRDDGVPR
jgi:hypothetical protein